MFEEAGESVGSVLGENPVVDPVAVLEVAGLSLTALYLDLEEGTMRAGALTSLGNENHADDFSRTVLEL